jgi:hypothetical protein
MSKKYIFGRDRSKMIMLVLLLVVGGAAWYYLMGPGAEGFATGDPPTFVQPSHVTPSVMEAAASAGTAAAAAAEKFGRNAAVQAAVAGEAASNALPPGATPEEHAKIALQAAEDASKAAGGTELQISKAKQKAFLAAKDEARKK